MDISNFAATTLNPASDKPMYCQIADSIAEQIRQHLLPPGSKLPPERDLATQFAVSRTTAINAYRLLERMELVRTKVGSGTYVTDAIPAHPGFHPAMPWSQLFAARPQTPLSTLLKDLVAAPGSDSVISMAAGMADPQLYPLSVFSSLLASQSAYMKQTDFGHIPIEGYDPLRGELAAMMAAAGMPGTRDSIMITSGSQQAIYLLSKTLLEPGDYCIVESPSYIGAIQIFQSVGARLLSLPLSDSLPLDLLEDYLIRYRPKLFYTMPTFQNPTGRVMPLTERQELLRLASRHHLIIMEDDAYARLYYGETPPPSLKSLDPYGGVIYLNTFSKILFSGLRIGWVSAPAAVIRRMALEKQYVDLHSSNLSQWLVYHYLAEGRLPEHLKHVRREYRKRRDAATSTAGRYLNGMLDFISPEGGFYLWCSIANPSVHTRTLLYEAGKAGVSFVPGEAFYAQPGGERSFRLCFVNHPEPILIEGIKRLAKAMSVMQKTTSGERANLPTRPIL